MKLFTALFLAVFLHFPAAAADPGQFRPPAVPLVTHDPYFSIWSMADHLTDEPTKHWTGTVQPLTSLVQIDGKTYRIMGSQPKNMPALEQTKLQVLPTHTIYQFQGAGIDLTLTFMTPALPDDLDVLSRPTTYLTWSVHSSDGANHKVAIFFSAGSQLVNNIPEQLVSWSRYRVGDLQVLRMGTEQQKMLQEAGDNLRIDWGYLYLVAPPGNGTSEAATTERDALKTFTASATLPDSDDLRMDQPYAQPNPVLAYAFNLGEVTASPVARHLVIAYDEIYAIDYFHRHLRPYWRRKGAGPADLLQRAVRDYDSLEQRTKAFDEKLMSDLRTAGGEKYALLCALAYRQTLAAHKLTADIDGTPLFFSKENFSNGSIDTVDVTYPSSPFFLLFNTTLLKAQLKPILDYASLPRWPFPFAPHDIGRYPLANGQQYGGGEKTEENQMPVEETGNMLLMVAAAAQVDGNANFARQYWPLLTKWAEYLKQKGLDPENQLSTDDFAGHLAHNANLSIKAILALGAYSKLAGMLGHQDAAKEYEQTARDFAQRWIPMANDGDHFKLAFDRPGTWSQKYNLVWNKLLNLNLFPPSVAQKSIAFYDKHMNKYGLPLDNRADYTKLDWIAWTASLAGSKAGFETLFDPEYQFANESPSRVPLTDWYDTKTGKKVGFQARSVVGGIFIEMLWNQNIWNQYANASHVSHSQ